MEFISVVEEWRSVVGWHAWYDVSDQGRVRSVPRVVTFSNGRVRKFPGRILKSSVSDASGHTNVALCRAGVQVTKNVHVLVMEAFVGPRPPGMWVLHGVSGNGDNSLVNLRYDVPLENVLDTIRHGRNHCKNKTECPVGHPLKMPNLVKHALSHGTRSCLACSRVYARVKHAQRYGYSYDVDALRVEYYQKIVDGTSRPATKDKTHCPHDHLLAAPNLPPRSVRSGLRRCLACNRANDRVRKAKKSGRPYDSAALRAQCYGEIMAGVPVPPGTGEGSRGSLTDCGTGVFDRLPLRNDRLHRNRVSLV